MLYQTWRHNLLRCRLIVGLIMDINCIEIETVAAEKIGISRQALHKLIKSGNVSPAAWKRSGRAILVDMAYFQKLYKGTKND